MSTFRYDLKQKLGYKIFLSFACWESLSAKYGSTSCLYTGVPYRRTYLDPIIIIRIYLDPKPTYLDPIRAVTVPGRATPVTGRREGYKLYFYVSLSVCIRRKKKEMERGWRLKEGERPYKYNP